LLVGALLSYLFFARESEVPQAQTTSGQIKAVVQPEPDDLFRMDSGDSKSSHATVTGDTSILNASGYITARLVATVSHDIARRYIRRATRQDMHMVFARTIRISNTSHVCLTSSRTSSPLNTL